MKVNSLFVSLFLLASLAACGRQSNANDPTFAYDKLPGTWCLALDKQERVMTFDNDGTVSVIEFTTGNRAGQKITKYTYAIGKHTLELTKKDAPQYHHVIDVHSVTSDELEVAESFAHLAVTAKAKLVVKYQRISAADVARPDFACPAAK